MKFGEILVQENFISQEVLQESLEYQKQERLFRIGEILCLSGYITPETIERVLQIQNLQNSFPEIRQEVTQRYSIIKLLGQGGMGKVYLAYDQKMKREVAIKILVAESHFPRFQKEFQLIAQLSHPNIVKVFDAGDSFFTMEYIQGITLYQKIKQNPSFRETIQLIQKIAQALEEPHQKKIIHRDLKPSNIMIDKQGEPKILDFGLAKKQNSVLSNNTIVGTPAYMPPEQAKGEKPTAQNDIYSIGAILYEMLVGFPPFQGPDALSVLYQVEHNDPQFPRDLVPNIPKDIETICLKCLEKTPSSRYSNATELSQDIQRYLERMPIQAKPISKSTRWLLRNKIPIAIFALLLFFLLALLYSSIQKSNARLYRFLWSLENAQALQSDKKTFEAKMTCASALEFPKHNTVFGTQNRFPGQTQMHNILTQIDVRMVWHSPIYYHHLSPISAIAFSDSSLQLASGDSEGKIKVWNIQDRKKNCTLSQHTDSISDLLFLSNHQLISVSKDGYMIWWDLPQQQVKEKTSQYGRIVQLADVSEKLFAAISYDGYLLLFNKNTLQLHERFSIFQKENPQRLQNIVSMVYSALSQTFVIANDQGTIQAWQWTSLYREIYLYRQWQGHQNIQQLFLDNTGEQFISLGVQQTYQWNIHKETGKRIDNVSFARFSSGKIIYTPKENLNTIVLPQRSHQSHFSKISQIALSSQNRYIAFVADYHYLCVYAWNQLPEQSSRFPYFNNVRSVRYSPDGEIFACADRDKITVWGNGRQHLSSLTTNSRPVRLEFIDNQKIVYLNEVGELHTWSLKNNLHTPFFPEFQDIIEIAISPNKENLAIYTQGNIIVVDLQTRQQKRLPCLANLYKLCFSENGQKLACGLQGGVRIWDDWRDSEQFQELPSSFDNSIYAICFTSDGDRIVFSGYRPIIEIAKHEEGKWLYERMLEEHKGSIYDLVVVHKKTIVSASSDATIRLWNLQDKREISVVENHSGSVYSLDVHPNGLYVLGGTSKGSIIWKISNFGQISSAHLPHGTLLLDFDISRDGSLLSAGDFHSNAYVWSLDRDGKIQNLGKTYEKLHHINAVCFYDRHHVFLGGGRGNIIVWNWQAQKSKKLLQLPETVHSLAISQNQKLLAARSADQNVYIYEIGNNFSLKLKQCLPCYSNRKSNMVFFQNDRYLISATNKSEITAWNLTNGEITQIFRGHNDFVECVAVTENKLISASDDATVRIWNIKTGKLIETFHDYNGTVFAVAWNHTGEFFAAGGIDKNVRITTNNAAKNLSGHLHRVTKLIFSPNDNSILLSASSSGRVIHSWNVSFRLPQYQQYMQICREHNGKIIVDPESFTCNHLDITPKILQFED